MSSRIAILEFFREYGARIILLLVVIAAFLSISPGFRSLTSVYGLLEQMAFVGVVAAGLAVTMIAGELDMSVASMAAVAGVAAIHLSVLGMWPAVILATGLAAILGLIQGYAIARLGINSLVFTVGTMVLLRGVAYILADDAPVVLRDFAASDPLHERYFIFSLGSLVAIAVFIVIGLFLSFTRPGRNIYAIGGARHEAIAAGVATRPPLTIAFGISGATAGLAGAIACLRGGSAAPEGFPDLLLLAVGAALVGGVGLYGGVGDIWHVLLGGAIVGAITVGMLTMAGPSYLNNLVLGILLLVLLMADFAMEKVILRERLDYLKRRIGTPPDARREPAVA